MKHLASNRRLHAVPVSDANYRRLRNVAFKLVVPMRKLLDQALDRYLPELEAAIDDEARLEERNVEVVK